VSQLERARAELEATRAASGPAPTEGEHARLRAVFHGAPVPTALVAPDGRFVDANAALCSLLGHSRERIVSDDAPAVIHPDDVDSKLAVVARMLAGEQSSARCFRRYVHADGHAITMRESLALLRDADGRPELFILQVEDADGDEAVDGVIVDVEASEELDAPSEEAMRRALEDESFQLHAQPVIDLRTNQISQYELLIRMVGEDGRLILPQAFLGPARRAGLAHAIDRWVVRQAIRLLASCPDDVSLEVNLSPEAIHDAELPTLIDQELATMPVDPARLILEVTGQTAAEGLEATRTLAKRIRALGCRFALDDFRSTFGSFRLLKDLPLDYLKLDGELVGSLAESRTSQLIVKALVEVASGTGTKTVAVFVSDEDTLGLLRQQGVDYAQGYRVGRPKPVADVWPGGEPAALPAGS
jgi:PAS domain S-box-containing protein